MGVEFMDPAISRNAGFGLYLICRLLNLSLLTVLLIHTPGVVLLF